MFRAFALGLVLLVIGCDAPGSTLRLTRWSLDGRPVDLPEHFDLPRERGTHVLASEVALPEGFRGRSLALAVPYFAGLLELRVDGELVPPAESEPWDRYRSSGAHRWLIDSRFTHDDLRLELVIDHRWTRSAWFESTPRLARDPGGGDEYEAVRLFNTVTAVAALASILMVSLIYLFISVHNRRTSHAWFALEASAVGYYPLYQLGLTQPIFGVHDQVGIQFALATTVYASVQFLHSHLRLPRPSRWWLYALLASFAWGIATSGPFRSTQMHTATITAMVTINIVYQTWWVVRLARSQQPRPGAKTILACWLIVGGFGWPDFATWAGLGAHLPNYYTVPLTIMSFTLLQAVAIGREHAQALRNAELLNVELAARIQLVSAGKREIETLYGELQRQVGDRSKELSLALARLSQGKNASNAALASGDVLAERYAIVGALGAGAMGVVYEALRLSDGAHVAAKVFRGGTTPEALARFLREAEIAARMRHMHVVSVLDVDVTAAGQLYIIMELVRGSSLEGQRDRFGRVEWALPILLQLAKALAAIHAAGIVHRDLKPGNVLLTEDGTLKLADFGIAAMEQRTDLVDPPALADTISLSPSDPRLTTERSIMGTPLYMAPELAAGASKASEPSDMFAFGVLAFELLTGELPFLRPPVVARLAGDAVGKMLSLADRRPDLPRRLAQTIDRCLAEVQEYRPSAAEVVEVLEELPLSAAS